MEAKDRCMDGNEEDLRKSLAGRDDSNHCQNILGFSYNMDFEMAYRNDNTSHGKEAVKA